MASRPMTGGRPGGRRRGRDRGRADFEDSSGIEDTLVKLYRCATVVKGGRRFSFGALVVVGDRGGQVGYGYGKANEVPPAVEKGVKQARRGMFRVPLRGTSIPHRVVGRFGASRIVMIPATEGTGVIAGAAPRAVLELAGVKDVLTKCYGSTSPKNLIKATINGLQSLRTRTQVEQLRGVTLDLPPEPEPVKAVVSAEEEGGTDKAAAGAGATSRRERVVADTPAEVQTAPESGPEAETESQAAPPPAQPALAGEFEANAPAPEPAGEDQAEATPERPADQPEPEEKRHDDQ
jgi:small subunit ribosomal protein S5